MESEDVIPSLRSYLGEVLGLVMTSWIVLGGRLRQTGKGGFGVDNIFVITVVRRCGGAMKIRWNRWWTAGCGD